MRHEIRTDDGTLVAAELPDGKVLIKVRAHGVVLSAAEALSFAAELSKVAHNSQMVWVESTLQTLNDAIKKVKP